MPVSCIVREEGGDEAAVKAAANYVTQAIRCHKEGKTLNGRPYVQWNSWTKRYEFLYVGKEYRGSFSQRWQETRTMDVDTTSASAAKAKMPTLKPESPPAIADVTPSPTPKAKAKHRANKPRPDPSDPENKSSHDAARRKEADSKLAKARVAKTRFVVAQSSCTELLELCRSSPDWQWCSQDLQQALVSAKHEIDAFKAGSSFWSEWSLHENFTARATNAVMASS